MSPFTLLDYQINISPEKGFSCGIPKWYFRPSSYEQTLDTARIISLLQRPSKYSLELQRWSTIGYIEICLGSQRSLILCFLCFRIVTPNIAVVLFQVLPLLWAKIEVFSLHRDMIINREKRSDFSGRRSSLPAMLPLLFMAEQRELRGRICLWLGQIQQLQRRWSEEHPTVHTTKTDVLSFPQGIKIVSINFQQVTPLSLKTWIKILSELGDKWSHCHKKRAQYLSD